MTKKEISKKVLKRRKLLLAIAWFLVKLNLLAIPLYILLAINFSFPEFQSFLASILGNALNLLGYPTVVEGYYIGMFEINMDCTAWKSMYLLAALAIATPAKKDEKIKFLLISLPLLFALNFARILTTIILAFQYGFEYLAIIHTFLWREGLIFAVIGFWYIWLRRTNYNIRKLKIPFRWKFA